MFPQATVILENKGSVARDHLASERTLLAYIRTSLAVASAGVGLIQLFTVAEVSKAPLAHATARPLGATAIAIGIMILLIGCTRYFSIQNKLVEGVFPLARLLTVAIMVSVLVLITTVFGLLVSQSWKNYAHPPLLSTTAGYYDYSRRLGETQSEF